MSCARDGSKGLKVDDMWYPWITPSTNLEITRRTKKELLPIAEKRALHKFAEEVFVKLGVNGLLLLDDLTIDLADDYSVVLSTADGGLFRSLGGIKRETRSAFISALRDEQVRRKSLERHG